MGPTSRFFVAALDSTHRWGSSVTPGSRGGKMPTLRATGINEDGGQRDLPTLKKNCVLHATVVFVFGCRRKYHFVWSGGRSFFLPPQGILATAGLPSTPRRRLDRAANRPRPLGETPAGAHPPGTMSTRRGSKRSATAAAAAAATPPTPLQPRRRTASFRAPCPPIPRTCLRYQQCEGY